MDDNLIKPGDWVIVQRQKYTKLHKLKENGKINLGVNAINLDNAFGHRYQDMFQMVMQNSNKRLYGVEKVQEITTVKDLNIEKSGQDNRNIFDDGNSQSLTKEEIEKMKEENSSAAVVEQLINNSKTFSMKTEYAQQKYMKKKEKKYCEYISIRKPTIRLLSQMFFRQEPSKTLGMRIDDLSQVLTYANVQATGDYLLYDSGTAGLMPAAILNAMGKNSTGHLIHMHPGNECQKTALLAMGFPKEQLERCINVNSYSVLRCFYQNKDTFLEKNDEGKVKLNEEQEENNVEDEGEPTAKKLKLNKEEQEGAVVNKPNWQVENERACKVLEKKVDSLVLTIKEHPNKLVAELLNFLKGGRQLVVFSLIREPLFDLYGYLKSRCDIIGIKVSNNFMREYQVLPERTHPEVNMSTGGYILSAIKLCE